MRAYFVGMFCDLGLHDAANARLGEVVQARRSTDPACRVVSIALAYDGLALDLDL